MITRSCKEDISPGFDFELIAPRERIVFLDIETTGLSARTSAVYLIGLLTYEEGSWQLTQFFADSMGDEGLLIAAFLDLLRGAALRGRVIVISFNGDRFDLPFLRSAAARNGLFWGNDQYISLDLFRAVRPYKRFLGTGDLTLKSIERAAGICREDRYSGGELIGVYEEYLSLGFDDAGAKVRDTLLETLLLHNAEDVMHMPLLMGILGYDALFDGRYTIESAALVGEQALDIHARLEIPLLRGYYSETDDWVISIGEEDDKELNIAVSLYKGTLKHFFPDYREYCYLPAEDRAVHRSVSRYVDVKHRRPATARTAYTRAEGVFIPEYEEIFTPVWRKDYGSEPCYFELKDLTDDTKLLKNYIHSIIKRLK